MKITRTETRTEIELTPEEAEQSQLVKQWLKPQSTSLGSNGAPSPEPAQGSVTAEMVKRAFIGTPPSRDQGLIIETVVTAYPNKVAVEKIPVVNVGTHLGGIGRALNKLPEYPKRNDTGLRPSRHVIIREKDPDTGAVTYRASRELVDGWKEYNANH